VAAGLQDEGVKVNPNCVHCSAQKDWQEGMLNEYDVALVCTARSLKIVCETWTAAVYLV